MRLLAWKIRLQENLVFFVIIKMQFWFLKVSYCQIAFGLALGMNSGINTGRNYVCSFYKWKNPGPWELISNFLVFCWNPLVMFKLICRRLVLFCFHPLTFMQI